MSRLAALKAKFDPENPKHIAAAYGGAAAGTFAVSEPAGRAVGCKRYEQGKHVNEGFFMGPAVNRGYYKAKRKAEGPGMNLNDGQLVVRKAAKDENSSPGVTWLQPRRPDGKFASSENDLKIYHPKFASSHRMPRQSRLMRYTPGGDDKSKGFAKAASFRQTAGYARIAVETKNSKTRERALRGLDRMAENSRRGGTRQPLRYANTDSRHVQKADEVKGMLQFPTSTQVYGAGARSGRRIR